MFRNNVYRDEQVDSPWANTDNLTTLLQFLDHGLSARQMDIFYVTQGIRTENTQDILLLLFDTLEKFLGDATTAAVVTWLKANEVSFRPRMNIVICDFVDLHNYVTSLLAYNFNQPDETTVKQLKFNRTKM